MSSGNIKETCMMHNASKKRHAKKKEQEKLVITKNDEGYVISNQKKLLKCRVSKKILDASNS